MRHFDPSLYFVCDPSLCLGRNVQGVVEAALKGGVTLIQLRCKSDEAQAREIAQTLQPLCTEYKVPLIVNDHVHLAAEIGADGVHIGQSDMAPKEARALLGPDKIIGLTAFTQDHIKAVDPAIIDYIGTGPVFPTKTDKGKPVLGPERFAELRALSPVPVIGIGGVTAQNAHTVIEAGANGIAMMRAISEAENPQEAAQSLSSVIKTAREQGAA